MSNATQATPASSVPADTLPGSDPGFIDKLLRAADHGRALKIARETLAAERRSHAVRVEQYLGKIEQLEDEARRAFADAGIHWRPL